MSTCALGKIRVVTTRHVGCDLRPAGMPGSRMMGPGTAEAHGLEGEAMACRICPYRKTCPRAE